MDKYKFEPKYVSADNSLSIVRHYDERQLAFRRRGEIIALWFFAGAMTLNILIMEVFYQWASYLPTVLIFASAAFLIFNIFTASKSAVLAVNLSAKKEESHAIVTLLCIIANLCVWLNDFNWVMIEDGKITKGLTVIIAGALLFGSFCINLYMVRKAILADKADKEK